MLPSGHKPWFGPETLDPSLHILLRSWERSRGSTTPPCTTCYWLCVTQQRPPLGSGSEYMRKASHLWPAVRSGPFAQMEPLLPGVALHLLLRVVGGFPSGAPASACESMMPRHPGVLPQPSAAPYTLLTSTKTFQPGRPITVTITGPQYRGVLLEARSGSSTNAVGSWQLPPPNARFLACAGNPQGAVTHSNTNPKGNTTTFSWVPPDSSTPVYFMATVAQQFSVYWVNVRSSTLTRGAPGGLSLASRAGRTGEKPLLLLLTCFLLLQVQGWTVR